MQIVTPDNSPRAEDRLGIRLLAITDREAPAEAFSHLSDDTRR
jgi:hypothetical protein